MTEEVIAISLCCLNLLICPLVFVQTSNTNLVLVLGTISSALSILSLTIPDLLIGRLVSDALITFIVPVIDLVNTLALVGILSKFLAQLEKLNYNPIKLRNAIIVVDVLSLCAAMLLLISGTVSVSPGIQKASLILTTISFLVLSLITCAACILVLILIYPTTETRRKMLFWSGFLVLDVFSICLIIYHFLQSSPPSASFLNTATILKTLTVTRAHINLPIPVAKSLKQPARRVEGMARVQRKLENLTMQLNQISDSNLNSNTKLEVYSKASSSVPKLDMLSLSAFKSSEIPLNDRGKDNVELSIQTPITPQNADLSPS